MLSVLRKMSIYLEMVKETLAVRNYYGRVEKKVSYSYLVRAIWMNSHDCFPSDIARSGPNRACAPPSTFHSTVDTSLARVT